VYSERLLDHFRNPRNTGELDPPSLVAEVMNPACGDILRLSVRFLDGRVAEARYRCRGCTAAVAAGSVLTEWMLGKTRAELEVLTASTVADLLDGLPRESGHAAALCVDAVRALLASKQSPSL